MTEDGINKGVQKLSDDIKIVIDDVINDTTCNISTSKKKTIKHNIVFLN